MVAGIVGLWALVKGTRRANSEPWGFGLVFYALWGSFFVTQCLSLYQGVYDEEVSIVAHNTLVRTGPMRGAMATPSQAGFLEAIDRDLKSVQSGSSSLTIFDGFATGYLSTRLAPRTFTQWIIWVMRPRYARALLARTFDSPQKLPDLMLEVHTDRGARHYWEKYFTGHYRSVIRRPEYGYVIWRKNPR
jgi:hypothetical protein